MTEGDDFQYITSFIAICWLKDLEDCTTSIKASKWPKWVNYFFELDWDVCKWKTFPEKWKQITHRAAVHLINNIKNLLLSLGFPFIFIYVAVKIKREREINKSLYKRHLFSTKKLSAKTENTFLAEYFWLHHFILENLKSQDLRHHFLERLDGLFQGLFIRVVIWCVFFNIYKEQNSQ